MRFGEFTYRILRPAAKKYSYLFKDLEKPLKRGSVPYSVDEYFSMCLFSIISAVAVLPALILFILIIFGDLAVTVFISILLFMFIEAGIVIAFYLYPSQAVESRKRKIDNSLYLVTIYMQTLTGSGAPPHILFRILGSFEEFGEIAKIARLVTRDIEIFGLSLSDSLTRVAEEIPSEFLRELFWGIKSALMSGGDLKKYLSEKGRAFTMMYKRKLEEYTHTVNLFLEMYITTVIVGSVLALILTTIIGVIGGGMSEDIKVLQFLLVTLGLPVLSLVFIIMLKGASPTEV